MIMNAAFGCACLFVLWLLAQVFLFSSFRIPSDSMSPTLREGDFVLVWKPTVGARVFNLHRALRKEQTEIRRLPGVRGIRRNDVLVFNFPHPNDWSRIEMHIMKYYIKRCIGLPGDTLSIEGGRFRVEGFTGPLGNLASQERIGHTRPKDFAPGTYPSFPYDSMLSWNIRDFGPLFIPGEDDTVKMDRAALALYRKPIEWETGCRLSLRDSTVCLNDSAVTSYRFRKNYCFVAGDRGENSQDSRYWGLLPEEYIVGVASRIWKSEDRNGRIRWDRVWKRIE